MSGAPVPVVVGFANDVPFRRDGAGGDAGGLVDARLAMGEQQSVGLMSLQMTLLPRQLWRGWRWTSIAAMEVREARAAMRVVKRILRISKIFLWNRVVLGVERRGCCEKNQIFCVYVFLFRILYMFLVKNIQQYVAMTAERSGPMRTHWSTSRD